MANMYNNPFIIGIHNNYLRQRPTSLHNAGYWYKNTNHSRFNSQIWPRPYWQVTNTYRKAPLQNITVKKPDLYEHLPLRIHTSSYELVNNTSLYNKPTPSVSYSFSNYPKISEISRNKDDNKTRLSNVLHAYFTIEDAIRPQKTDNVNKLNDLTNAKMKSFNEVGKHFKPLTIDMTSISPTILESNYNKNNFNELLNIKVEPSSSTFANLLQYSMFTNYDIISTKSFNSTISILSTSPSYTSTNNYFIDLRLESKNLVTNMDLKKSQHNFTTSNPLKSKLTFLENNLQHVATTQKSIIPNELYMGSNVSNYNLSSLNKQTQIKRKLRAKSYKNNVSLNDNNKKIYVKLKSRTPTTTLITAKTTKPIIKKLRPNKHPLISRNVSIKIHLRKSFVNSTKNFISLLSKKNETRIFGSTLSPKTSDSSIKENNITQSYSSSESAIMRINNGYYNHDFDISKKKFNTSIIHGLPNITVKNITNDKIPQLPIEIYFKKIKDL